MPISRSPFCLRTLLLLTFAAALLALAPARADVRKVAPGKAVELGPNEGLLLIAVDTPTPLAYLKIKREGALFDGGTLRAMPKGRTSQLYVVPAGRYRWESVLESWLRFKMDDDEEYAFDVKPGVINYPGDLVYRPRGTYSALMHVANRGLLAIDWLDKQHPAIAQRVPLAYVGHYPDPVPAMYREAAAKAPRVEDRTTPVPAGGTLPVAIDELWRPSRLTRMSINPAGDLVGVVTREKRGDTWFWLTSIIDLRHETVQQVIESPSLIGRIDWSGSRALVVSVGDSGEPDVVFIVRVEQDAQGKARFVRMNVPRPGVLVDALPDDPDHILFSSLQTGTSRFNVQVHKLDITSQKALDDFHFSMKGALDRGVVDDVAWLTDGQGRLRLATAYRDETLVLMHESNGVFREVLSLEDREVFSPMALSADGNTVYGWTEKDRGQRDLVEFDLLTGKIGRTLFSRPGADVQTALFDGKRNLIGATYFDGGQLVSHYFDHAADALQARVQRAFPGKTVNILDRDAGSRHFLLLVGGSDQPSVVYHYDLAANRASLLEETRPWLSRQRFAPAHLVRAKSRDGLDIEAYLTLPQSGQGGGKLPLVLFPHGGPIGVRDSRFFDPEVQFLASLGYAVLQVNFRGSDGYGKAFREAGKGHYGTLIEDDIDAALNAAIAAHPIDRERMCAMGASYGGYSAMVSAIRWPGRFKCVVSMAGVSDRVLFFTASDSGRSEEGRKLLEEAVGDPRTQLDQMQAYSPLYRHDALDVPVMLVHGTEDLRVDYEHSRRLLRMLNLDNRPPVVITLEDEGHGLEKDENVRKVWEGVAGFLRANLGGATAVAVGATQP
jgi:dipeptidyl aminopeptidase/acylaminoacyl peptidase